MQPKTEVGRTTELPPPILRAIRHLQATAQPMKARLVKRSFTLCGHRTSVALEAEFWAVLAAIAHRRRQSLVGLIAEIDASRAESGTSLASTLRLFALRGLLADEISEAELGPSLPAPSATATTRQAPAGAVGPSRGR